MTNRESGVLLHITSLPGPFGIGDIGPEAYRFVDFLRDAGQSVWQILPLTVTSTFTGNSPYSSLSAFALNPLLVSPELLVQDNLVDDEEVRYIHVGDDDGPVHYKRVKMLKEALLRKAFSNYLKGQPAGNDFLAFQESNASWLRDYSRFVVLKNIFGGEAWHNWSEPLRDRDHAEIERFERLYREDIEFSEFVQFVLHSQWSRLRDYCHSKRVRIMGDLPIYVEADSADVWNHPACFRLNHESRPELVAGVPPDYFSSTGQLWGNPVYDWDYLRSQGYSWWLDRLQYNLRLYDVVRIDHFRGLVQFWAVPAHEETAVNGQWVDVPTHDFFDAVFKNLSKASFVAEDLGIITDDVREAMARYQLPGMKILLFAFNGNLDDHPYLPHNFSENSVVYTGTHDNNTVRGWFDGEMSEHEEHNLRRYLHANLGRDFTPESIAWDLTEIAWRSPAKLAIVPLQDLLGLGASSRMNRPGFGEGCWMWRCASQDINSRLAEKLLHLTEQNGRR